MVPLCTYVCACKYVHMYVCLFVCVCMFVRTYVCMYVCLFVVKKKKEVQRLSSEKASPVAEAKIRKRARRLSSSSGK